ncbi:class I SAM-dependent methyltransferase [Streptomyces sp. Ru72]|nr:class I SAM-dependent methyltransferase [Streptomyces sp. Ru72]
MDIDQLLIENVISAATAPASEISARVADLGPATVAEVALAEVAGRAALHGRPAIEQVGIQFQLAFGSARLDYVVHLGPEKIAIEASSSEDAPVTIKQDLVDLLYETFGPAGNHGATREVAIMETVPAVDPADPVHRRRAAAVTAFRQLLVALSGRRPSLTDLALAFGSDKWGGHWYTPLYERYFEPYSEQQVKVLEIGVGGYRAVDAGGASLRMWKHYFRRGMIYGLDLFDKSGLTEPRLRILQGDQGDQEFLATMAREHGPFDIVIDDGSHFCHHVIASFNALFPHVRPGGMYVVEDLQTSYWPGWGGNVDPTASGTSMSMIKSLLDGLNHQEQMREGGSATLTTERLVTGVHAHHNIVFIDKGLNTEQGAPAWIPRTAEIQRLYDSE